MWYFQFIFQISSSDILGDITLTKVSLWRNFLCLDASKLIHFNRHFIEDSEQSSSKISIEIRQFTRIPKPCLNASFLLMNFCQRWKSLFYFSKDSELISSKFPLKCVNLLGLQCPPSTCRFLSGKKKSSINSRHIFAAVDNWEKSHPLSESGESLGMMGGN